MEIYLLLFIVSLINSSASNKKLEDNLSNIPCGNDYFLSLYYLFWQCILVHIFTQQQFCLASHGKTIYRGRSISRGWKYFKKT